MMKTMGCETELILPWALEMVTEYRDSMVHADAIAAAMQALQEHVEVLKACPWNPDIPTCQKIIDSCLNCCENMKATGIAEIPKMHYWAHMSKRVLWHGPPMFSATFLDESLNLQAARAASAAHNRNFETRYFERLALLGDLARGQGKFWCGSG